MELSVDRGKERQADWRLDEKKTVLPMWWCENCRRQQRANEEQCGEWLGEKPNAKRGKHPFLTAGARTISSFLGRF